MEASLTSYFFEKQLPKLLLGEILPNVRSPHLNSQTKQLAKNEEQWDKDDYSRIEIKDRLSNIKKAPEGLYSGSGWDGGRRLGGRRLGGLRIT